MEFTPQAILFDRPGPPADVLRLSDHRPADPRPGQVSVRMTASPINPSDEMFIRGTYGTRPVLPQVPGFEGTGYVVSSGGGLRGRLFTGKRVAVLNAAGGNWAHETVVPASSVIPLSARLSDEQAATFFVNPTTAYLLTQHVLKISRGDWLVQTAAASSLGQMVIRLGQRLGFRTLNIVRSERHTDTLRKLGGDAVVVFDADQNAPEELTTAIAAEVGGDGVSYAIDPVGGPTGSALIHSLARGGRLITFGTLSDQPLQFSGRELMTRQASVEGFWLGHFMASRSLPFKLKLIKRITRLVLDGTLATDIARTVSLAEVPGAFAEPLPGRTLIRMT